MLRQTPTVTLTWTPLTTRTGLGWPWSATYSAKPSGAGLGAASCRPILSVQGEHQKDLRVTTLRATSC